MLMESILKNRYYDDDRFCEGTIYFKDDDIIRIIGRDLKNVAIRHIDDNCYGKEEVINKNVLKKKYIRLIPVGYMNISVNKSNKLTPIEDLIINYQATAESSYYDNTVQDSTFIISSYSLCNVIGLEDIASIKRIISNGHDIKEYLTEAMSLIVQTDIEEYDSYDTYDRISGAIDGEYIVNIKSIYNLNIAVYLDDTLDSILSVMPTIYKNKYNKVLVNTGNYIKEKMNVDLTFNTKDISTYLKAIDIINYTDYINCIYSLSFKPKIIRKGKNEYDNIYMMNDSALYDFINERGHRIKEIILIRYWYDFDINRVSSVYNCTLIRNTFDNKLYIMSYVNIPLSRSSVLRALSNNFV